MNSKALAMSAGDGGQDDRQAQTKPEQQQTQQQQPPGVMKTTMADVDQALTELQGGRGTGADAGSGAIAPDRGIRQSFQSERTADLSVDDHTDGGDGEGQAEDEYQSRANARAALAANAKANAASQMEKERAEQERMRNQAQKMFEEEEARQRDMLLQKEAERKQAAANGELDLTSTNASKAAPIAGVDMSDESDSEGSVNGLDAYPQAAAKTHSPLFGVQDRATFAGPQPVASQQSSYPAQDTSSSQTPTFTSPFMPSSSSFQSQGGLASSSFDDGPSPSTIPPVHDTKRTSTNSHSRVVSGLSPVSEYEAPPYPKTFSAISSKDKPDTARGSPALASQYETPAYPKSPRTGEERNEGPFATGPSGFGGPGGGPASYPAPGPLGSPLSSHRAAGDRSLDQRYSAGSAAPALSSNQFDSASGFGSGTQTAATSVAGSRDAPKSAAVPSATGSPVPSFGPPRQTQQGGDPNDWGVEQVVEWARSKGWDEASVVSKFQEHEISGDVLLEMDINILKEIDISAFGKRFQVANAIKELKGGSARPMSQGAALSSPGAPPAGYGYAPSSHSARTTSDNHARRSQDSQPPAQTPAYPAAQAAPSGFGGSYGGWANGAPSGIGMGPSPSQDPSAPTDTSGNSRVVSFDRSTFPTNSTNNFSNTVGSSPNPNSYDGSRSTMPRSRETTGTSAGAPSSPSVDTQTSTGVSSPGRPRGKTLSELADEALISRKSVSGASPTTGASSPNTGSPARKRDSGGAKQPGSGERASFFGRMKRGGPGSTATSGSSAAGKGGKISHSDLKNQISLPTSSPTYDSVGDTARRGNIAQGNGANGGSDVTSSNFNASVGEGEGPVMGRIRPVDLEGWMKKKGERYNSWKPRYLALRGSDLVILRDPSAPKIKGYVSMKGYKVIADENTNPGKYGFKILHETEKPHYFSSDDPVVVRDWMKGLMKATIGRDHSFPVISSYNNATISLVDAQKMNPPPRPPSPMSRARTQKAKVRDNTTELTAKDAAVLSSIPAGGPGSKGM